MINIAKKPSHIVLPILCLSWLIFTLVAFTSWGNFHNSGRLFSGVAIPLFLTAGLGLTPFALWFSYRAMPKIRLFLAMQTAVFGLIAAWLLILVSSFSHPDEWTCLNRDYSVPLIGFWLMTIAQFIIVLPRITSETHAQFQQQSTLELLLTQASVLSLYTTPWVAGLHCGTYSYTGDFVLRGIMVIFLLACIPILMILGIIGVSRWNHLPVVARLSTVMSLAVSGGSCAFCCLILSFIVLGL